MLNAYSGEIPAHVPRDLVMPFRLRLGEETYDNPFTTIVPEIHRGPPVYWAPQAWSGVVPAWVFRRAEDLNRIYLDTEHFSNKDFAPFATLVNESWSSLPVEADPPMHGHYRRLVNPLFSPRRVAQMNDSVRRQARFYIDRFRGRGSCEFIGEFAARFPIAVFLVS